jgi:hypothetical protein
MPPESDDAKRERLKGLIERSRAFYNAESESWCPYFKQKVTLNSDGFNHLQYKPNRQPRNIDEQILKLSLLKKAVTVIKCAGTVQEIRDTMERVGKPSRDGFYTAKKVQYWGFHAILGDQKLIKIVVVVKRTGDGKPIFWSVLPHKKFNKQKLYSEGIEED